jgi:hypothetical protein
MLVGVDTLVLFEILWSLEELSARVASVRLEGCVYWSLQQGSASLYIVNGIKWLTSQMTRNVITLCAHRIAVLPPAC